MTGGKRKPSSRPGSAVRTASDEYGSLSLPSSQFSITSSLPVGVSPQPTSHPGMHLRSDPSQLETSRLTDKSLSELSENEKSHWRQYSDPRSFFEYTGWDSIFQEDFENPFSTRRARDIPFQVQLEKIANLEVLALHFRLRSNETINWTRLLTTPRSDTEIDDMIFTWIELKKINYDFHSDRSRDQALVDQLVTMIPVVKRKDKETQYKEAELAFHTEERHLSDGTKASDFVYDKLVDCYNKYNQTEYLAPYTSIVGPSGVGKSFIIQQLAISHGIYTVYVSFARISAYPGRSAVADKIPHYDSRESLEGFWKIFITASLAEVKACKVAGITPAGFYNLQTKDKYHYYQTEFADQVENLSRRYRNKNESDRNSHILSDIATHISSSEKVNQMSMWRGDLEQNDDNGGAVMKQKRVGRRWIPDTFLCFDESRELVDSEQSLLFRSLRIALRNCFGKGWGDFLGILLDTTSRVANFSPPVHLDSSQKTCDAEGHGRKLLPPIYQIKTMDVFVDDPLSAGGEEAEAGSAEAAIKLFRYGRPLWGGRDRAGKMPSEVASEIINLASQKTDGGGPTKSLALISYRLEFYLTNSHLAEQMVSNCLRFVAFINMPRCAFLPYQST